MKAIFGNLWIYIVTLIYAGASYFKISNGHGEWAEAIMTYGLFFFVIGGFCIWITRKCIPNKITIKHPRIETIHTLSWFCFWLILYVLCGDWLMQHVWISNLLGFWLLLVILPGLYLLYRQYDLKEMGLSFGQIKQNLWVSLCVCLFIGAILILLTPGGKFITSGTLPVYKLTITLFIAFGYGFFFAGFFEEFFFRSVLQTRMTSFSRSPVSGIAIASLIFGLYHFPFQFFGDGAASGIVGLSLANVLTEQMISGPIFGILWYRTRSLIVPVIVHSFIDAISGLPTIAELLHFL